MTRPFPTPRVGWQGNGWDRRLSWRARHPATIRALRGEHSVTARASVPRTTAVLSAAAVTSVAGAAATIALARSVNAALKTHQPSSSLPEGTNGGATTGSATGELEASYVYEAAFCVPDEQHALPPVDAEAHARRNEKWKGKWENAYASSDSSASNAVTLTKPPGFHQARVHPLLRKHKMLLLGQGVTCPPEPSRRVFVPLCGASPDMLWLAACGHRVFGVELSGSAARGFFDEKGLPRATSAAGGVPARHTGGIEKVHVSGNVAIVEGDIFSLDNAGPESRSKSKSNLSTVRDGGAPPYATAADFGDGSVFDGADLPQSRALRHSLSSAATDALAALGARVTRGAVKTQNKNKTEKPYASDADASYAADARVGARHSISFAEECLRFAAGGGPAMDAVWDRGALVAVAPDMRRRYARVVAERIAPGGRMLLVTVSYDEKEAGADAGPPFSVPDNEVRRLYEPLGLSVRSLGSEECLDTAPPRMRERLASMRETVYLVEKPRRQKKRR